MVHDAAGAVGEAMLGRLAAQSTLNLFGRGDGLLGAHDRLLNHFLNPPRGGIGRAGPALPIDQPFQEGGDGYLQAGAGTESAAPATARSKLMVFPGGRSGRYCATMPDT